MLAGMAKLLTLILGLLVVSFVAWKAVSGRSLVGATGEAAPAQTLQEARGAAKRIDEDSAKRTAEKLKAGDDR